MEKLMLRELLEATGGTLLSGDEKDERTRMLIGRKRRSSLW